MLCGGAGSLALEKGSEVQGKECFSSVYSGVKMPQVAVLPPCPWCTIQDSHH